MFSLMTACFSFEITHKEGLRSVYGVNFFPYGTNGITGFTHQRSHTYRRYKDEGHQAVCAWEGGESSIT